MVEIDGRIAPRYILEVRRFNLHFNYCGLLMTAEQHIFEAASDGAYARHMAPSQQQWQQHPREVG
jgi:hypothetical protein